MLYISISLSQGDKGLKEKKKKKTRIYTKTPAI